MDNNFFSLNKEDDWKNGQFNNIQIQDNKIQISSSKRYIYEKSINLDSIGINDFIKACTISQNGILYFLDKDYRIRMYDYDTKISELILNSVYKDKNASLQYSNGNLYVCYKEKKNSKVDIISIQKKSIVDCIDKIDGKYFEALATYVDSSNILYILCNNGMLYCINKKINLNDKYNLSIILHKDLDNYVESSIILKGCKNQYIFLYDKKSKEFYNINLNDMSLKTLKMANISSIGLYKNKVVINRDENIKSTIYAYDNHEHSLKKLPFVVGRSNNIDFDNRGKIYIYNYENNEIRIFSENNGISYNSLENAYKGIYYSGIFDSLKNDILWDKIVLDADIPNDCIISMSYYAFDEQTIYYNNREYIFSDFITSKKINLSEKEKFMHNKWKGGIVNFKKALFRDAVGRYMIIKLEFWGNNIKSPSITKMRVYYDRQTYTKYLPEIYTNESKDSFLDRYLSLFESFMQDIEEKIDFISHNFDPEKTSGDMLRWLCSWLDIDVDFTWSDDKIRKLIKRAPYIFERRGTKEAIEEILEIYLGVKPIIIENFQLNCMRQNAEMIDLVNSLYGNNPYNFTVLAMLDRELSDDEKISIKKILDNESPAYCTYKFVILEPWMALDKHTYLGINSQILNWSELKLDGKSILPYNAILEDNTAINKIN